MRQFFYLYKTTNLINGNYYIGVHSSNNPEKDPYCGSGSLITKAVAKYGRENFKVEILQFFDSWEDALEGERIALSEEVLTDPKNYNLVLGGRGASPDSTLLLDPETYKVVRVARVKAKQLLEQGYTIARRYRLHKGSVETLCPEHLLEDYLKQGWKEGPTKDHCRKISSDHKGRQHTAETKDKIRIALTGKVASKETREKISASKRGGSSAVRGSVWLTRGSEKLRALPGKDNIEELIANGWKRGSGMKGRIGIMNKEGKVRYIFSEELNNIDLKEWHVMDKSKPKSFEDRTFYFITDEKVTKKVPAQDLTIWLGKGWRIGRKH